MARAKSAQPTEQKKFSRNDLLKTMMQLQHGDLKLFIEPVLAAGAAEPEFLQHFMVWHLANGVVRDLKTALPALALRTIPNKEHEFFENSVACALSLPPEKILQWYNFSKELTAGGQPIKKPGRRFVEAGLRQWIDRLERNEERWDDMVMRHRDQIEALYRISHLRPYERGNAILFNDSRTKTRAYYPEGSVFWDIEQMRLGRMSDQEAAGTILKWRLPWEVSMASWTGKKTQAIVLAMMEVMTGNQLIKNTKGLKKLGVGTDKVLTAAYDRARERAGKQGKGKVETLTAGRAAAVLADEDPELAAKLITLQRERTAKLKSIKGKWAVLADRSGSMSKAIDPARHVAALITERVKDEAVYLIYFNHEPLFIDVTGLAYDQIMDKTRNVKDGGSTAIGVGMQYLGDRGLEVNGVVIISDGGDNCGPMFPQGYEEYVKKMGIEPIIYYFCLDGSRHDALMMGCEQRHIQIEKFDLGNSVDYASLPGLIETLNTNRYGLVDKIMDWRLLTFEHLFGKEAAI